MARDHLLEDRLFPPSRPEPRAWGVNWPMFSAIAFCMAVWVMIGAWTGVL
jgi:hypothetical protein